MNIEHFAKIYATTLQRIRERNSKAIDKLIPKIDVLRTFMQNQENWFEQMKTAYEDGYYIEVMTIGINQIDSMLRVTIWIDSQINLHKEYESPWTDEYTYELLLGRRIKIAERDIYDEALRCGLIDSSLKGKLHQMYHARNEIFHNLFADKNLSNSDRKKALEPLAKQYLEHAKNCINLVYLKSKELSEEADQMIVKIKNLQF